MPIYHKTPPSATVGSYNAAEIDYHTSEAAKVKRTREQAYFNSYDFDAIEVLPCDDEEDDEDERGTSKGQLKQRDRERRQIKSMQMRPQITMHHPTHPNNHHQQQPQQQQYQQQTQLVKPQQISNNFPSTRSNTFMTDNRQQQPHRHPLHLVNSKDNSCAYLQRLSSIFVAKANSNKTGKQKKTPQQQQQQEHQQQHQQRHYRHYTGVDNKDNSAAVAVNTLSHDNKHLKLSSSETSSTSLSSTSIIEEVHNVDAAAGGVGVAVGVGVGVSRDVLVSGSGLLPLECTRDVTAVATRTTTSDITNLNVQVGGLVPSITTADSATTPNTTGNGGSNFLLPRAMLKYQSSTSNIQLGAAATTAGTANSMPLATNASISNSNNSSINVGSRQQQQHREVLKLESVKGNNAAMMPVMGSNTPLRLKKTSSSSSVLTSLASEDIEGDRDSQEKADEHSGKLKKDQKVLTAIINDKTSARASSHQSHYSTDKSASSGYYSSNVCSTYSLEEHIYSEPTLDLKKLRNNASENKLPSAATTLAAVATATPSTASTMQSNSKLHLQQQQQPNSSVPITNEKNSVMRSLDKTRRYRFAENDSQKTLVSNRNSQEFSENLKILESSIENLDRHLKSFPGGNPQEAIVNYTQNAYTSYPNHTVHTLNHNDKMRASSSYQQLPTIQESHDVAKNPPWSEDRSDDSLMDIDLDSFLLEKDKKSIQKSKQVLSQKGVDNPTFLTDEQEENHYKCAKYINSCPDDAYRVESDIIAPARSSISGQSVSVSVDLYPKRYEDQLHFQNTRELLEDVRDKIRLLTQTQEAKMQQLASNSEDDKDDFIPKELHLMINTLKQELELYLERMNQHSEQEIRQLCTGLVKNHHIVKMKNAFERRRSSVGDMPDIYSTYKAVQDGIVMTSQGVPISITQQITSIRCSSDPNFKMKRKSLAEVFPMGDCYVESLQTVEHSTALAQTTTTQLQRNLSYQKPVLDQLKSNNGNANFKANHTSSGSATASGGDTSETNDKDSILDWHRKKPSIWEMYYGTNRIQQSLLGGKKNGMMVTTATGSSPSTMCYPSSRPESDFTLDLPRAEQLRIKMEKEKKFRQRCRVITTFLSLVFFLLTVMVVSLVLTRGKRMFGSMI